MVGKTLSHYKILSELGRGGMGIVYKGEDTKLDRRVAIKVLPASALSNDEERTRFYREAKAAAQLHHPHIASIFEIDEAVPEGGSAEEPRPFIVMEFIDGEPLDQKTRDTPLALEDAVRLASQIAEALEQAHEKNIVHRDIKSANVMMTKKGDAKVLDFGLAKTAQSTMLTRMGSTMGTIAYMSPEQARGEEVDSRTDLWALGVVMYELITGRHPFGGDYEQAVVYGILNEDPQPLTALRTGVPTSIDWIIGKLLAKKKEERYQTATDLLVDLRTVDLKQSGLSRTTTTSHPAATTQGNLPSNTVDVTSSRSWLPWGLLGVGLLAGWGLFTALDNPDISEPVRYYHRSLEPFVDTRWPVLSESGRYLAFGGRDSSDTQAQLRIVDLQTNVLTTVADSNLPNWPSFSPDESRIAFVSNGQLKLAALNGSSAVSIASSATETVLWDDDGSIYFVSPAYQLMVMHPEGSFEPVLFGDSTVTNVWPQAIIPDSDWMIMGYSEALGLSGVDVLNLDTGERKKVLDREMWYLRYLDSGHLVVQTGANGRLVAYPFSPDRLEVTGLPQPIEPQVNDWNWSTTRSGMKVSYLNQAANEMEFVEFNETGLAEQIVGERLDFEEFQFSNSGDQLIAEVNGYENGVDQIILYDLANGTSRQLTSGGQHFEPTLSSDGKKFAVASIKNNADNIAVFSINGSGEPLWITDSPNRSSDPDWSYDGNLIAYDRTGDGLDLDIWVYDFANDESTIVVDSPGNQSFPRFSRTGRFLAYQSDDSRRSEISVLDLETGAIIVVTRDGGTRPAWGPSDSTLYFRNGPDLKLVDISTADGFSVESPPRTVQEVGTNFYFDVSSSGRVVIARSTNQESVIIEVIQNWSSTLQRP